MGISHGQSSGAEDLLVLHLVVVDEEGDRGLGEVFEGHPSKGSLCSPPLLALEASHQGVDGSLVGVGPRLLALSIGQLPQVGSLLLPVLCSLDERHLLGVLGEDLLGPLGLTLLLLQQFIVGLDIVHLFGDLRRLGSLVHVAGVVHPWLG